MCQDKNMKFEKTRITKRGITVMVIVLGIVCRAQYGVDSLIKESLTALILKW